MSNGAALERRSSRLLNKDRLDGGYGNALFPEEQFADTLGEVFQFCRDYYNQKGYRSDLLYAGYRILQDRDAWLSYARNGNVMTIDPVSTGNPGCTNYLEAYNEWCIARNRIPLRNQTDGLKPAQLRRTLGSLGIVRKPAPSI